MREKKLVPNFLCISLMRNVIPRGSTSLIQNTHLLQTRIPKWCVYRPTLSPCNKLRASQVWLCQLNEVLRETNKTP